jgi:aldehyde:ferredoxin oxidoreductase
MHKPEYETLGSFGSLCLTDDLDALFKLNDLCNRGGVDTISCGAVVAFAIECFENGILTEADTGGLKLAWGDGDAAIRLVEMIVAREGIGDVLAEGVLRAARKIGRGADRFAVTCGGVEPPMHDPKFDPGFAPVYHVDPTPGRHTTASYTYLDLQVLEKHYSRARKIPMLATHGQRHTYTGAGEAIAVNVMFKMLLDAAGICLFGASVGGPMPLCEWLNAATGWNRTKDEYLVLGDRIQQLRHAFNVREGIRPFQDWWPHPRVVGNPPFDHGPAKGVTIDLDTMSREFCQAFHWDPATGRPDPHHLEGLGMSDLAGFFEKAVHP